MEGQRMVIDKIINAIEQIKLQQNEIDKAVEKIDDYLETIEAGIETLDTEDDDEV